MPTVTRFFDLQLTKIDHLITTRTIILGDFNLDLKKADDPTYSKINLIEDLHNKLGHHNLNQCCDKNTWSRVINGVVKQSLVDHIYGTQTGIISNLKLIDLVYGDHKMLEFSVTKMNISSASLQEPIKMRS